MISIITRREGGKQKRGEGRGRNGEGSEGGWKKRWRKVRGRVEGREGRSDGYKDGGVNANHCCHQRKNFLRLVSISFLLCIHSNSPNLESKVPLCKERSLRVNLGPSSCSPAFL